MTNMARSALLFLLFLEVGLIHDVCGLSPPSGLLITSINLKHTLSWHPLQNQCDTTVLYSVQYQGDFERSVKNGSWLDGGRCQLTPLSQCDLSSELASDSDYNLRVRGHCGRVLSLWQQLDPPFNRKRHTVLLMPELKLDIMGSDLLVSVKNVPQICAVRVSLWRKGRMDKVEEQVVHSEQVLFKITALLEGEEYCVKAQSELPSGPKSNLTAPLCVRIPGPGDSWKKPTTVALTVLILAGFLCTFFWFLSHCKLQNCHKYFKKEALPPSLEDWDVQMPIQTQEEHLEQIHILQIIPETSSLI